MRDPKDWLAQQIRLCLLESRRARKASVPGEPATTTAVLAARAQWWTRVGEGLQRHLDIIKDDERRERERRLAIIEAAAERAASTRLLRAHDTENE
jgi:hypothetical protein